MYQAQAHCRHCGRATLHAKTETFTAGIGLLLTIITAGLFGLFWILIMFLDHRQPWRCQFCGSETSNHAVRQAALSRARHRR